MRVAVLNGPNLNLLGTREPDLYGRDTLADIERSVREDATRSGAQIVWHQTNHEGEFVELVQGLAFGRFEQRPPRALDPAPGRRVRAVMAVPFVAADLVGRARREPDDVERVKANLGVRNGGADGAPGHNALDGQDLPAKTRQTLEPGATLRIETPGGGGWGSSG